MQVLELEYLKTNTRVEYVHECATRAQHDGGACEELKVAKS